ncbi:hypothetical protein ACROYT_G001669 [Oculina patagonica]
MEEFEMDLHEAVQDAIDQFKTQGVDLSNLITSYVKDPDTGELKHSNPVKDALDKIRASLQDDETQSLLEGLRVFSLKCDKSESNRKFAASKDALILLFSSCNHCYLLKDKNNLAASLDALSSFLHGQGDLADAKMIEFLSNCLKELKEEILVEKIVKAIRVACIKSESNRQTFVANDVLPCLVATLKEFRQSAGIVKETCTALRVFTFDDDMSVAFGKAHEHAKLIVAENAFAVILEIMETCKDVEMASELCVTLSRLAVRNEYCKDIVDLGGLKMVLNLLKDHTSNQNIAKQVCTLLRAIAGNDDVKTSIVDAGGLGLIVVAMTTHAKQPMVAEQGCAALGSIALRSPANCTAIVGAGGVEAILKAMQIHAESAGVQKQACLALRNLVARNPEHCEIILEAGAESLIRKAHGKMDDCEDLAKAALRDLGCDVELKELWTGTGQGRVQR